MLKNPAYDVLGGDPPGETGMGTTYGKDIDVSRASYDAPYDYGESMCGAKRRDLKRGYVEVNSES